MIYQRILFVLLFLPLAHLFSHAQGAPPAEAYFLTFSLNAQRLPVLCNPIDSATASADCYGVDYDNLGRPIRITRLFFGNFNSRGQWTIMKFRYDTLKSGSTSIHRSWHNPAGMPVQIGVAHGETALYDSTGFLIMYTSTNEAGERVEKVNAVTRSMFRKRDEGFTLQEWKYSNNKQFPGSEEDIWNSQFAPLDRNAWFRQFRVDDDGFVQEESPLSLAQHPSPFPDGVYTKKYERGDCGQLRSVSYYNQDGLPMTDSSGIGSLRYDYDEVGRVIGWTAHDLKGNLKGRIDMGGAARMTREYRPFDGKLIRENFYDENGEKLELSLDLDS
ncbi:MAG: hypothetical protein AB7H80_01525 [Candidatus Kapaibacterium sp.]